MSRSPTDYWTSSYDSSGLGPTPTEPAAKLRLPGQAQPQELLRQLVPQDLYNQDIRTQAACLLRRLQLQPDLLQPLAAADPYRIQY